MNPRKLLIVFDWDGVIFNTAPIKNIRNKFLKKLGYSEDHIISTSREAVRSMSGYNFYSHAKLLTRNTPHNSETLAKMIHDKVEKHSGTFVFSDARRMITILKREKYHFDILTSGHSDFQEYKIARSNLRSLFRNVHIVKPGPEVPRYKIRILKKLSRTHNQIIFLDDRPDTIEMIQKSPALRGKVVPVLVWRKKEKPPKGPLVLRSLSWTGLKKIAIRSGFRP